MPPPQLPDDLAAQVHAQLSADWLASQRWFRGKSRPLARVELHDAAALDDRGAWLLILSATDVIGTTAHYLAPMRATSTGLREPGDADALWQQLVALIAAGAEVASGRGRFRFQSAAALGDLLPGGPDAAGGLAARRLDVEQSNTAVTLGDRLFLKLYRRLDAGINPDLEVSAFLSEIPFRQSPALAGSVTYEPARGTPGGVALLVERVRAHGDAWAWLLGALARVDGGDEALAGVRRIGALTADLHAALASRPAVPRFPSRRATDSDVAEWRASADRELDQALAAIDEPARSRLGRVAGSLRTRLSAIDAAVGTPVSRIHGDYHLGQLLHTDAGFVATDFEGEPARPLTVRCAPTSPVRDVAGMLRSFDYAAQVARAQSASTLDTDAWLRAAREAFFAGYGPLDPVAMRLCTAFEMERACYEVRYEADNRPAWVSIPLTALERLAAG